MHLWQADRVSQHTSSTPANWLSFSVHLGYCSLARCAMLSHRQALASSDGGTDMKLWSKKRKRKQANQSTVWYSLRFIPSSYSKNDSNLFISIFECKSH